MLRLATLSWMAVAIAVGLLLYNVKHEVQELERQLARTNRAIHATQERIHVLEAEWSLLNEPERLRALAARHLDLVPMRPGQFVEASAIAALPVAQPRAEAGVAAATTQAPPGAAAQTPAQAVAAPSARATERPAETRTPAESRRDPRPAAPPSRLAPPREEPLPPPRQAAPQPRRELEAGSPRQILPGAAPPPTAAVLPAAAPTQPRTASALGGPAATLPPPVPVQR